MAKQHDSTPTPAISDKIYRLCTSGESVSALLAADPTLSPGDAWSKLYSHHVHKPTGAKQVEGSGEGELPSDALERAFKCGNWGPTRPSDLFLRIYHDALATLDENPGLGRVSPSLMGSCGVMPLTIISVIPDIVRHMSNLIVRAEKEVILATNYWADGVASAFITNAIRELSRRAGERGEKVVVKVIYDRGSPKQLVVPRLEVNEKGYTAKAVNLPHPSEIPNVDMQVINYHHPLLGTFHAKFMVVDRKIGVIQSNNIQDNDNLEMMTHVEGPIVDSLYDMALISWDKKFEPPLPSANSPAAEGGLSAFQANHGDLFGTDGTLKNTSVVIDPAKIKMKQSYGNQQMKVERPGAVDPTAQGESQDTHRADVVTGPSTTESVTHEHPARNGVSASAGTNGEGSVVPKSIAEGEHGASDARADAFLAQGAQPISTAQISEPVSDPSKLPEHNSDDHNWDVDIAGEIARVQTAVSPKSGESRMAAVTRHLNHTTNVDFKGDAPESEAPDEMTPYIPHPVHEPFPMALVNRAPYGPPNHKSVANPQNAAWLSALRNAQKNVFIQSPTLNAEPLIPAIIEACERGVDVYCYICLGYNDAGELLPMQGGHNEMVAHNLYRSLSAAGRERLHWFWYIGKDQTKPIPQEFKKRSCHIKLMIVDERIGIQGSGNQDTQSWFHSQEVNVLLESEAVCRAWIDGLRRNQNTHLYGAVNREDGIWRDADGNEAKGAMGVDPGRFSWAKGLMGAVHRVRGTGGF